LNFGAGWLVGDEIVIASAGGPETVEQNEKHIITAIAGNTVTISDVLIYDHSIKTIEYAEMHRSMEIEVINLSRNVKIGGAVSETPMYGGHLVGSKETEFIKLSSVEFFNVGQAFSLGKYPIHFHLAGSHPNSFDAVF